MEVFCGIALVAGLAAIFIVHRLGKGKLGLFDKSSAGSGSIIALQEIVEPNVKHVIQIKEQKKKGDSEGSPPDPLPESPA
jgi:hypothetical protein